MYYKYIYNRAEKAEEEGNALEMTQCRTAAWHEWMDATIEHLETENDLLALEYDEDLGGGICNAGLLRRRLTERRDRAAEDIEAWKGIMDWMTQALKRIEEGA